MKNNQFVQLEKEIENKYTNIAGIAVMNYGDIIYEKYFNNYTKNDTIHVASVTKSIISGLIGIAIDKGYIKNVNQKVLDFFSDYKIKRGEKTIQKITIKHLLTMTAPYKYNSEPYTKVYSSKNWTKTILDLLGGKGIIGQFKYSTVGTHVLSSILVRATSETVRDFAIRNLFNPLGIQTPHNKIINNKEEYLRFLKDKYVNGWVVDFNGINTAGWGLTLTLKDMVKFGQLYLNKGMWKETPIISTKWIEDSTRVSSRFGDLSYGYLWWIINDIVCSSYAALGDGGNVIYVCPEKKLVVAIASSFKTRVNDRINLIRKFIIPFV